MPRKKNIPSNKQPIKKGERLPGLKLRSEFTNRSDYGKQKIESVAGVFLFYGFEMLLEADVWASVGKDRTVALAINPINGIVDDIEYI